MPIKVKYVGPLDTKVFLDYTFIRDVSDDASGGENAVELPDNIANAALKHRNVFMQWNLKVPQQVKDLREKRVEALEREGQEGIEHWAMRLAAAGLLADDTPAKKAVKDAEKAGAKKQVDYYQGLVVRALTERAKLDLEAGTGTPAVSLDDGAIEGNVLASVLAKLDALTSVAASRDAENAELRAKLEAITKQMADDARALPSDPVSAPEVGEFGIDVEVTEGPAPAPPAEFPDIFAAPAAEPAAAGIPRRGRPPKDK